MKIVIASDHAGSDLRRKIRGHIEGRGHEVTDLGPVEEGPVDYPDYAARVAIRVASGEADRGILVCGTGQGMAIAANKIDGIRAVAPHDENTARLTRLHNDSNVACFGGRVQDPELVLKLTDLWLETAYEGGRHDRRLGKIRDLEKGDQDS